MLRISQVTVPSLKGNFSSSSERDIFRSRSLVPSLQDAILEQETTRICLLLTKHCQLTVDRPEMTQDFYIRPNITRTECSNQDGGL